MHIGSVLSGLDAGNVNPDAQISIVGFGDVYVEGSKMTIFRCLETLEGTFIRKHMRQSCLGCIVEGFYVVGMQKKMQIVTVKY